MRKFTTLSIFTALVLVAFAEIPAPAQAQKTPESDAVTLNGSKSNIYRTGPNDDRKGPDASGIAVTDAGTPGDKANTKPPKKGK